MMGLRNRAGVCPPIRARCRHLRRHSDGSTWRQALHQVWRQLEDDFLDRVVIFGPEFGRNWRGPIPVAGSTPIQRPQCVRPLIWPPILATGSFRTVASPPPPHLPHGAGLRLQATANGSVTTAPSEATMSRSLGNAENNR